MTDMYTPSMQDNTPGRIEVNGVRMGLYQLDRPLDVESQRPILVLLHGFTGNALSWRPHMEYFASAGIQSIALDMLGHGASDAPSDPQRYTMEHCQEDILAALRSLGIGPGKAVLLGYSMGGRIALYCGLSHYFRALILESASPGLVSPEEREKRRQSDNSLAQHIEQDGLEAFVNYWERIPLFATQQRLPLSAQQALHAQRLQNNVTGLANSLRGVGTGMQPALHNRLSELNLPTLLITGEEDTKFCAIAQTMAQQLPRVQHHTVPQAGHTVHLEQPEEFNVLVRTFCLSL